VPEPGPVQTAMRRFSLRQTDLTAVGAGLRRPECVLATSCGELYVSDARGGVTRISPDGSARLFTGRTADGPDLGANGFALLPDGSFLIAPLAGGGVFQLRRDGQAEPFLMEVDGRPLHRPNFVLLDESGRVWICCLTQQERSPGSRYPRSRRDGFIVLVDRAGARIAADGIGYPNEVRVDLAGRYLYADETMAGRLLRYRIGATGTLGRAEVVAEFDESNVLDGFTLDSTGGVWLTAIVSNRLWYLPPGGQARLLIEDPCAEQLARVTEMQKGEGIPGSALYEDHGSALRSISSVAFGGPDLRTAYLGNLLGTSVFSFRSPVAGPKPPHWDFGPFG
jgi:sugar lactone lactonase YvrE